MMAAKKRSATTINGVTYNYSVNADVDKNKKYCVPQNTRIVRIEQSTKENGKKKRNTTDCKSVSGVVWPEILFKN